MFAFIQNMFKKEKEENTTPHRSSIRSPLEPVKEPFTRAPAPISFRPHPSPPPIPINIKK